MSVEALAWAFEQEILPAGKKFVLIALANHADAQGKCFPSQNRLGFMTGQDPRTVRRHLAALEKEGYITRQETRRKSDNGRTSDTVWLNAPPDRLDPSRGATGADDRVPTKRPVTPPDKMTRGSPRGQNDRGGQDNSTGAPRTERPDRNHQLEPADKTSSSSKPTAKPQANQPTAATTATQGEKEGARKRKLIRRIPRTLKGLLPRFLEEDRRRQKAWFGLTDEQQDEAFRRAQERSKQPAEQRAFSTLLKDELDEAAGLNVASTTAPHTVSPERAQLIESAKSAQEEAFLAALDAGRDSSEAEREGTRAYREVLQGGITAPSTSAPAAKLSYESKAQVGEDTTEPQSAFAMATQHLTFQEWSGGNVKHAATLAKLTPEQDQAALQRAMDRCGSDFDTRAFALLVIEELRREAGLNPTKRPNVTPATDPTPNVNGQ